MSKRSIQQISIRANFAKEIVLENTWTDTKTSSVNIDHSSIQVPSRGTIIRNCDSEQFTSPRTFPILRSRVPFQHVLQEHRPTTSPFPPWKHDPSHHSSMHRSVH